MFKNISQYVLYSLLCVSLLSCSGDKNDIVQQQNESIERENNNDDIVNTKSQIAISKNNNESETNAIKETIIPKKENNDIAKTIEKKPFQLFFNHTVVAGDTLWGLASQYDVGWKYIYWNNTDILASPSSLAIGQVLKIPSEPTILHEVKIGETISDISSRYEVPIDKILEYKLNKLNDINLISVGDIIYIPNAVVQFFQVTLSFYYCKDVNNPRYLTGDGGDFCGIMRNGQKVYPGAAACAYRFLGQKFVIVNDPLKRVYECADTGNLVLGWHRDIWFNTNEEGWNWLRAVGTTGDIMVIE